MATTSYGQAGPIDNSKYHCLIYRVSHILVFIQAIYPPAFGNQQNAIRYFTNKSLRLILLSSISLHILL
jgi:hypothetical protein